MAQPDIDSLTNDLEAGNASGLVPFMQGKFLEERLDILESIREQNQLNRQENPNVPELQITSGTVSPARSYERIHLLTGGPSNLLGGRPLYVGCTDLSTLERCDNSGGSIPESRTSTDLNSITEKLEQGTGKGIASLLSPLSLEERVRVFNAVDDLNEENRRLGKTDADLDIRIRATKVGTNEISVYRNAPESGSSSNRSMLYYESFSVHSRQRNIREYGFDKTE